jgi:hypothetical protein
MVPLFLLFDSSLISRIPRSQREGIEEAMRRIRGSKEEKQRKNRGKTRKSGEAMRKIAKNVSFVPQYALLVPGFRGCRPNLPGVLEKKMSFVPGFGKARPKVPGRPSHF